MSNAKISKQANNKVGQYTLQNKFTGYNARTDQTTVGPDKLVSPSQNVLIGTSGRVGITGGYTLDGAGSATIDSGIQSNYDFENTAGEVRNLRCGFMSNAGNDGKLQYRYTNPSGTVSWVNLMTGLTSISLNFCDYWDKTNLIKDVLWVDGSSNIYLWNGAVTQFASSGTVTGVVDSISSLPNNGGSGYTIGDILNISGGTGATVQVTGLTGGGVSAASVLSGYGGQGYMVGDVVTAPIGFGSYATFTVSTIGGSGGVTGITILNSGTIYYTTGTYRTVGGTGEGLFINVTGAGAGGQVSTVKLLTGGSGYSAGTGNATTGGTGSSATIAIATVLSGNTLTKQGITTWQQEGFYPTGSITVDGVTATYTGGYSTKTLVGVNVVISASVGDEIHQTPVTTPIYSCNGVDVNFTPTVIGCGRQNQVYLGSSVSNNLYISKVNNYADYTFSTPTRLVGEGSLISLDASPNGFVSLENRNDTNAFDLYISEGMDTWGIVRSTLSSNLENETLEVMRMKVTPLQGAQSQKLISKMKNHIVYVGYDKTANFLGYISYQNVPETVDFGYTIINDMSSYDFTDGQIFYYKNYIYLSVPKSSLIRVYNMTDQTKQTTSSIRGVEDVDADQPWFWEAPITFPISGFYINAAGQLCGHSYTTSESYVLFSGGSFNGQQITANATFGFDDNGDRTQAKGSNELWVDGYISQNTILNGSVTGDLGSFASPQVVTINGSDNTIVAFGGDDNSLGDTPLGSSPLGGSVGVTAPEPLPPYFNVVKTYPQNAYHLEQIAFSTQGIDLDWELISFGTNKKFTTEGNNAITQ